MKKIFLAVMFGTIGIIFFVSNVFAVSLLPTDIEFELKSSYEDFSGVENIYNKNPQDQVIKILNVVFSGIAVVFLAFIIWAGYRFMTAGGDTEARKQALQTIRNAVIGVAIIFSAYIITAFVMGAILAEGNNDTVGGTLRGRDSNLIERQCLICADIEDNNKQTKCFEDMKKAYSSVDFNCGTGDYGSNNIGDIWN